MNPTCRTACLGAMLVLAASCSFAQSVYEPYTFSTLAGLAGGPGKTGGLGNAARFKLPQGLATDQAGNFYVGDTQNHTIRKVTPTGVVTTLAGLPENAGSADGTGSAARFNLPQGLAVDSVGNIYVADTGNHTIRKVTPTGAVTTLAGAPGVQGAMDGLKGDAQFNKPGAVAVDDVGNVYVADTDNSTIRKVTPDGLVSTLAGMAGEQGRTDGDRSNAHFIRPLGITLDALGNVYVADTHTIRKITPEGAVSTLAGSQISGTADGTGAKAQFLGPVYLTTGRDGNIYASDGAVRKVTLDGVVTSIAGNPYLPGTADGTGYEALFNGAAGLAMDASGNIFVADCNNCTIRKVTPEGVVTTPLGRPPSSGYADGTGAAVLFGGPSGLAIDSAGNIYVADGGNNCIRKVTSAGLVTTAAGSARRVGGFYNGPASNAVFRGPSSVAVDGASNLYVADSLNHIIRKVSADGMVTTYAGDYRVDQFGNPQSGYANDGPANTARFKVPCGLALDSATNLYVADTYNNVIRKITPESIVSTVAGGFDRPQSVAVDSAGNLYVSDSWNFVIRKITPYLNVTVLAGSPRHSGTADGIGSAARFGIPGNLALDSADNVYVADSNNQTFRKITPAGVVTTLGGVSLLFGGEDGAGEEARFYGPAGVAVDARGQLYVSDGNNVIRRGVRGFLLLNAGASTVSGEPRFGFTLSGRPVQPVIVQASTDLLNWLTVSTNAAGASSTFSEAQPAGQPARFFRAYAP